MRQLIIAIITTLFCNFMFAQNVDFVKSNFKSNPDGFKTAYKQLQEGDGKYYTSFYKKGLKP